MKQSREARNWVSYLWQWRPNRGLWKLPVIPVPILREIYFVFLVEIKCEHLRVALYFSCMNIQYFGMVV